MPSLQFYRQANRRLRKGRKLIPTTAGVFPSRIQKEYMRDLKVYMRAVRKEVDAILVPALPTLKREYDITVGRFDGYSDSLFDLMKRIGVVVAEKLPIEKLKELIKKKGLEVNDLSIKNFQKQTKQVAGVSAIPYAGWTKDVLNTFVNQNVTLIKTIETQFFKDIEVEVIQGLEKGLTPASISEKVGERFGVSESRVALIARDQISKLNSNLAEKRATDVGVKSFIWSTSQDNRVRDSHEELDGKEFTYEEGATVDGETGVLPGRPINCRCVAIPVFSSIPGLEELGIEP